MLYNILIALIFGTIIFYFYKFLTMSINFIKLITTTKKILLNNSNKKIENRHILSNFLYKKYYKKYTNSKNYEEYLNNKKEYIETLKMYRKKFKCSIEETEFLVDKDNDAVFVILKLKCGEEEVNVKYIIIFNKFYFIAYNLSPLKSNG